MAVTLLEICSSYRCAVTQHQCTAALFKAKCNPHRSVLLCKTGSQHACATVVTPVEICYSCRCAVMQHQCTAALVNAKCNPTVQCCSAKQAHSRHCVTAVTLVKIYSSYRCAVTQHQCTAALFKAKCNPHCSVLLGKTGSQHACATVVTPMEICYLKPHRALGNAFRPQNCGSALVWSLCTRIWKADLHRCIGSVSSQFSACSRIR